MIEARYTVPDMSCAHCKSAVEDTLRSVSGVETAVADPSSKVVVVAYEEGRADEARVRAAIENAGYTVAA